MKTDKLLFVVGPARSGTTFVSAVLNRSDQVFLFGELNSWQLLHKPIRSCANSTSDFAFEFNERKDREGNTRQKGSYIPNAERLQSVEELFSALISDYRITGEKVALCGPPSNGEFAIDILSRVHTEHYFHANHLFILRRPSETLESQRLMFPETPLEIQLQGLVRTFRRIFELSWILPRARLMFYERLSETTFEEVFKWLRLDWGCFEPIPFRRKAQPDWPLRRIELLSWHPVLSELESVYEEWLRLTEPSPFWLRSQSEACQSAEVYDLISSALACIDTERRAPTSAVPSIPHRGTNFRAPGSDFRVILKTSYPQPSAQADQARQAAIGLIHFDFSILASKLTDLYPGRQLKVLDFGCQEGFLEEIAQRGCFAVGLSDHQLPSEALRGCCESRLGRILSCNWTQPFSLHFEREGKSEPGRFEVVSALGILEHTQPSRLARVLYNVRNHLDPDLGLFITSIQLRLSGTPRTIPTALGWTEWQWRNFFRECGFFPVDRGLNYFWTPLPCRSDSAENLSTFQLTIVLSPSPDGALIRRIDRLAAEQIGQPLTPAAEFRSLMADFRQRLDFCLKQKEDSETALNRLQRDVTAYTWPNLCRVAAAAIERCRTAGYRHVALYGVGDHTASLRQVWNALEGPEIVALVVTQRSSSEYEVDLPVVEAAGNIPRQVQAVVPSSRRFEAVMRETWFGLHPELPWIDLWERR